MAFTGALAATLELRGHYLAALAAGLVYVMLFLKSQLSMVRHGL